MKKALNYILLTSAILIQYSCKKEIPPLVNLGNSTLTDSTYISAQVPAPDVKRVLVEESTGDLCVNCPSATALLEQLNINYSKRLDVVSIHYGGGALNNPHPDAPNLDLRPDAAIGDAYVNFLGGVNFQPVGAVDRHGNTSTLMQNKTAWSGLIAARMQETTPVNLKMEMKRNAVAKRLEVKLTMTYTSDQTSSDTDYVSVILLESGIIGAQDSATVTLDNYRFDHVFRTFLTSVTGERIIEERVAGRVIIKTFAIAYSDIKADWNIEHLSAVGVISKNKGLEKTVVQSYSVHL